MGGATMVRIAMDADNQHWDWVDDASGCGLYVLIDYHYVGAAPIADDNAKNFFRTAAQRFASNKNVMYELFNEPADMPWSDIKSYHEEIISVIRPIDPQAIIVCGTPAWSGRPGDVVGNTIDGSNIMYTKHFYAASHHDQDDIGKLLLQIPIFVTEWGICDYSGDGNLDFDSAVNWQNMMDGNNPAGVWVSWANWGWNDKSCSYMNPGGSLAACIQDCPSGAAFQTCVTVCEERCGSSSQCGADDGDSLSHCISNCPSDSFETCVGCCEDKFPSIFF